MCFNSRRKRKAIKTLEGQLEALDSNFQWFSWKPLTLSLMAEYLGADDDIYQAISKIDFRNPIKSENNRTPEEIREIAKAGAAGYVKAAIKRIEAGKLQPERDNFFCKIPLAVATAIAIAFFVTIPIACYYWGRTSGHNEYSDRVEGQSLTIQRVQNTRDSLAHVLTILRDSLASPKQNQGKPLPPQKDL